MKNKPKTLIIIISYSNNFSDIFYKSQAKSAFLAF